MLGLSLIILMVSFAIKDLPTNEACRYENNVIVSYSWHNVYENVLAFSFVVLTVVLITFTVFVFFQKRRTKQEKLLRVIIQSVCIYFVSLVVVKGTNAKAKANAATGLPEMIKIAVGKNFRENHEVKHKRDAKNGWYRYDSRFALPVYDAEGELERYNVFHASMLIRHSNDGKMYLYDVIDIKKETSNSLGE